MDRNENLQELVGAGTPDSPAELLGGEESERDRVKRQIADRLAADPDAKEKLEAGAKYVDEAVRGKPSPAEEVQYQDQLAKTQQDADEKFLQAIASGEVTNPAEFYAQTWEAEEKAVEKPAPKLPGILSPAPKSQLTSIMLAGGLGLLFGMTIYALQFILWAYGAGGPMVGLVERVPDLRNAYAWGGGAAVAAGLFYSFTSESQRGLWPFYVWGSTVAWFFLITPFWFTAAYAAVTFWGPLLLSRRIRARLADSVKQTGRAFEPGDLIGKPKYSDPVFTDAFSLNYSGGPAAETMLPQRTRTGTLVSEITATSHWDVKHVSPMGRLVEEIVLDAYVASTGNDDLLDAGRFGSGAVHIVGEAVACANGERVIGNAYARAVLPSPTVADWGKQEVNNYLQIISHHLNPQQSAQVLAEASRILEEAAPMVLPPLVRYRLETLNWALKTASYRATAVPASAAS